MKRDNPKKEIILYDDKDKYDDVIDEAKVGCTGVQQPSREIIHVERLQPHRDNEK